MANKILRFRFRAFVLGLAGLLLSLTAVADDGEGAVETFEWYADVVACYRNCSGFQASFTHEAISAFDKRATPMKGTIWVANTGLFKMVYRTSASRQVLFDGKKIRGWDSETGVAVEESGKGNALFTGLISRFGAPLSALQAQFDMRTLVKPAGDSKNGGYTVVEFVPKAKSNLVQKMVVTLGTCPSVRRVIVVDRAGNMIRLTFENAKTVKSFPPTTFRLRLPPGTKVVRP